jgi:1-acyl-sn-glycerol-3-phosphate acyltransferase
MTASERHPRAVGGAFTRAAGRWLLGIGAWRVESALPELPRFVICVAPHTSNWDFFVAYGAKLAIGLRANWLGKHTIFRGPFGPLLRWMGGIAVDRRAAHGVVEQVAARFMDSDAMVLAVAPEGTRKAVTRWKTGFYHIARIADVPVVPVGLDWDTRRVRIGEPQYPSGDEAADLERLMTFFRRVRGRHPERAFPQPSET